MRFKTYRATSLMVGRLPVLAIFASVFGALYHYSVSETFRFIEKTLALSSCRYDVLCSFMTFGITLSLLLICALLFSSFAYLAIIYFIRAFLPPTLFADIKDDVEALHRSMIDRMQYYWDKRHEPVKKKVSRKETREKDKDERLIIWSALMRDLHRLQSIFVNATGDISINISLYLPKADGFKIVMKQEYFIAENGSDKIQGKPKEFEPGEGILGLAWHYGEISAARRKKFAFLYDRRFKAFRFNDAGSARSVLVCPIKTTASHVCFALLSIESNSYKTFDPIIKRDSTYRIVMPMVAQVFGMYSLLLSRTNIRAMYGHLDTAQRQMLTVPSKRPKYTFFPPKAEK